jgi:hypothetical protein
MDSNALKKSPRHKSHRGAGNMKSTYKSFAAAKGAGAAAKTLHSGQPVSSPGKGLKTGHAGTNTGKH